MPSVFANPNPFGGLGTIFQGLITLLMSIIASFAYLNANPQAVANAGPLTILQIGGNNIVFYAIFAILIHQLVNSSHFPIQNLTPFQKRLITFLFPILIILGASTVINLAAIASVMSGIFGLLLVLVLLAIPFYYLWKYWQNNSGSMTPAALVGFGVALVIVSLLANGLLCVAVPAASFCAPAVSNINSGNSNSFNTVLVMSGGSGSTPTNLCGNGAVDAGEDCDPVHFAALTGSKDCTTSQYGSQYQAGNDVSCTSSCEWDMSACQLKPGQTPPPPPDPSEPTAPPPAADPSNPPSCGTDRGQCNSEANFPWHGQGNEKKTWCYSRSMAGDSVPIKGGEETCGTLASLSLSDQEALRRLPFLPGGGKNAWKNLCGVECRYGGQ